LQVSGSVETVQGQPFASVPGTVVSQFLVKPASGVHVPTGLHPGAAPA
jgi:hypothetical protein